MIPHPSQLDPLLIRKAFASFPSGVAALAAVIDGEQVGLVASTFTVGVSLDPPLVLFAVQNNSATWPVLRSAPSIGISVMGEAHDLACRQLASKAGDRFAGIDTEISDSGAIFVNESPIWMDCTVQEEVPAGDHHVVLLKVNGLQVQPGISPLVFHGSIFRQLAKAS